MSPLTFGWRRPRGQKWTRSLETLGFADRPETPAVRSHVIRTVADLRWTNHRGGGGEEREAVSDEGTWITVD